MSGFIVFLNLIDITLKSEALDV